MTALTELGSLKVKKPKPRERPLSASRMIVQCVTSPNCSKYILSVSVARGREDGTVNTERLRRPSRTLALTVGGVPVQATNEHFPARWMTVDGGRTRDARGSSNAERSRRQKGSEGVAG